MMSILTLALMVVLVTTTRKAMPPRSTRFDTPAKRSDDRSSGRFADRDRGSDPGVVSYKLMRDRKLPSATTRALRRMARPFGWLTRRFSQPKADPQADRPVTGQSVELQNFLDARNREIARRKAEGSKRGPEDTLH